MDVTPGSASNISTITIDEESMKLHPILSAVDAEGSAETKSLGTFDEAVDDPANPLNVEEKFQARFTGTLAARPPAAQALFKNDEAARALVAGIRTYDLGSKALKIGYHLLNQKEGNPKTEQAKLLGAKAKALGSLAQEAAKNAKAAGRLAQMVVSRSNGRLMAGEDASQSEVAVAAANAAAVDAALIAERVGRKVARII